MLADSCSFYSPRGAVQPQLGDLGFRLIVTSMRLYHLML